MVFRASSDVSPSLRHHHKRLQPGSHDKLKSQDLESSYKAPRNQPSVHKNDVLKRRRAPSLQDSSLPKASRQDGHICNNYDSEGYEIVEPVDLPTPSTIEIINTSDTERPRTPDALEEADAIESCGSNDSKPSKSSALCTADPPRSSSFFKNKRHRAVAATPGRKSSPCGKRTVCPHCCIGALLKPNLSDDDVPDLSPNTYIYVRNLGLRSPDGSFPEHWANYPISFVPSTFPLGPRDLDPGHYNCPYPGCIDPFGPCGRPDGYTGKDLALHIYRHHGYGPAVERVRLDLHKRVMIVRRDTNKDSKDAPMPYSWMDPGRDLDQAIVGLIQDLDEIRQWERSLKVVIPEKGKPETVMQTTDTDQSALPAEQESVRATDKGESKGQNKPAVMNGEASHLVEWTRGLLWEDQSETEIELEAMGSPSPCARTNHFARLRDNRFQRPQGASLLHLKEVLRTPKKKYEGDDDGTW
ncbi:hypothetical protein N0V93_007428 [Gnomoniopsis smithogilvyi]|uniref:Uncharacterized protein n=1 Tax=Gnomoniopsis smithogilvyi TaxID=1191159 RepID=A0A9W8YTS3_9PEZI|nr:hypothetical protein N0V93_007428 [Gnomoniopsis smithogilvyi]